MQFRKFTHVMYNITMILTIKKFPVNGTICRDRYYFMQDYILVYSYELYMNNGCKYCDLVR